MSESEFSGLRVWCLRTIVNITGQEITVIVSGYSAADLKLMKRKPLIRSRTQIVSGTGIILPFAFRSSRREGAMVYELWKAGTSVGFLPH